MASSALPVDASEGLAASAASKVRASLALHRSCWTASTTVSMLIARGDVADEPDQRGDRHQRQSQGAGDGEVRDERIFLDGADRP